MSADGAKMRIPSLDGNIGHGYGTIKQNMGVRPSPDGYPYDTHQVEDPEDLEVPFDGDMDKVIKFLAKTFGPGSYSDPNQKSDKDSFVSHQTVARLPAVGENKLRLFIRSFLSEDIYRLRSRSSEPDGAVDQWGRRIPGGTQFGWSSAYPFVDDESEEQVFSMKQLVDKTSISRGEIPEK